MWSTKKFLFIGTSRVSKSISPTEMKVLHLLVRFLLIKMCFSEKVHICRSRPIPFSDRFPKLSDIGKAPEESVWKLAQIWLFCLDAKPHFLPPHLPPLSPRREMHVAWTQDWKHQLRLRRSMERVWSGWGIYHHQLSATYLCKSGQCSSARLCGLCQHALPEPQVRIQSKP